jgi:hypothetical protein
MNKWVIFIAAGTILLFLLTRTEGQSKKLLPVVDPTDSNTNYVGRLIDWYERWNEKPEADVKRIQSIVSMKDFFEALKKDIPVCRGAKMITRIYFDIFTERDIPALRHFLKLMSQYYGDDNFQWHNSIDWKQGNFTYKNMYDKLFKKKVKSKASKLAEEALKEK